MTAGLAGRAALSPRNCSARANSNFEVLLQHLEEAPKAFQLVENL